ncbi:MAG: DUF3429 domain-containing protein, partial [Pseudomonadota bacterium]
MTVFSDDPIDPNDRMSLPIALMGYGGLIPFFAPAFLSWMGVTTLFGVGVIAAGQAYGAVILSFLGGIRWGLAVSPVFQANRTIDIVGSVVPSLLGWVALLMPPTAGIAMLIAGFIGQLVWDLAAAQNG